MEPEDHEFIPGFPREEIYEKLGIYCILYIYIIYINNIYIYNPFPLILTTAERKPWLSIGFVRFGLLEIGGYLTL